MKTYSRNKPMVQLRREGHDIFTDEKNNNEALQNKKKSSRQCKKSQQKISNRKRKKASKEHGETSTLKKFKSSENCDSESSIEVLRDVPVEVSCDEIKTCVPSIYKQLVQSTEPKKSIAIPLPQINGSPLKLLASSEETSSITDSEDCFTYAYTWVTETDAGSCEIPSKLSEVTVCASIESRPLTSQHGTKDKVPEFLNSTVKLPSWKQSKMKTFPVDMSPIAHCHKECDTNTRELNEKTPDQRTDLKNPLLPVKGKIKTKQVDVLKTRNSTVLFKSYHVDIADVLPDLSSIQRYSGENIFSDLTKDIIENKRELKKKTEQKSYQQGKEQYSLSKRRKLSFVKKGKEYGPFNLCPLSTLKLPQKRKVARYQKVECSSALKFQSKTIPKCSLS